MQQDLKCNIMHSPYANISCIPHIVQRQQTTYFFIVRWLIGYGALSLYLLACLGLYLNRSQIFFLAGEIGWGSTHLRYGIQFYCASFGVFGRNGISRLLRFWIVPVIRCLLLLVGLVLIGLRLEDSRLVILSLLSLALFFFVINLQIGFLFCFFFVFSFLYFLGLLYVLLAQSGFSYI